MLYIFYVSSLPYCKKYLIDLFNKLKLYLTFWAFTYQQMHQIKILNIFAEFGPLNKFFFFSLSMSSIYTYTSNKT